MAFFNDVKQKTKELADSAKLSSTISEEEKKIQVIYTEIGKRYYALHSLDTTPEFPEQIAAISACRQRIKDCQEQIQRIKSVVRCSVCGSEIPGSAAFCTKCGSPLNAAPVAPVASATCSDCNAPLQPGVRFCTKCGTPVAPVAPVAYTEPEMPVSPVETMVEEATEAEPVEEPRLCPQCGQAVDPDTIFCTNCGEKL